MRVAAAAFMVLVLAIGCGSRPPVTPPSGARAVDFAPPPPARPHTARLAIGTGNGARRLALWTATNARGELCIGWRVGASRARPPSFTCLRRGLERPVLAVEAGGGDLQGIHWGILVGLASRSVGRIAVDQGQPPLRFRGVPWLHGWRAFTSGVRTQPPSALTAYARGGRALIEQTGVWIGSPCDKSGTCTDAQIAAEPPWTDTYSFVADQSAGPEARATTLALGVPGVRKILRSYPGWIDSTIGWGKCNGDTIGRGVIVKFWKPITFRATLPFEGDTTKGHAYESGVHRVLAVHSRELYAWVDLNDGRVAGVATAFEHGDEIQLGTVRDPKPGGGADTPGGCDSPGD